MIENKIKLKGDWEAVDNLIDQLIFIRESHDAIHNVKAELEGENSLLRFRYTELELSQIDEYFADDVNDAIINYVTKGETK